MVNVVTPKVTLIASTSVEYEYDPLSIAGDLGVGFDTQDADDLAEFAGRACYQAFHRPNPATARNEDYLANILRQGHESVLEHASATFYIEGVSRALTHELIRHRHLSYSQLSQRFVNEGDSSVVYPPAVQGDPEAERVLRNVDQYTKEAYEILVKHLQQTKGYPRKQAREAARAALPNMTETKIVVTGNHRAWRDVLKKRNTDAADAEIREVSQMILDELVKIAPASFQDLV